ncbi:MAG: c-type cytochrome [Marinagarivorans sp.]|nr:c-type cytochrome [Marinagarivorans sp.]
MLVKKTMLLKCKFLSLVAVTLLLGACADDVVVEESLPSAPRTEIPFDQEKARAGKDYYEDECEVCHGVDGLATSYPAITQAKFATEDALASDKLMAYTEANMPPAGLGECDGECADAIQHYFYQRWSEAKGSTSSSAATNTSSAAAASSSTASLTLPDRTVPNFKGDVSADDVAKGKELYTLHNCGICHGTVGGYDGEILNPKLQSPIHNNLDYYVAYGEKYEDLYFTIHDSMPPGKETSCENDCAEAIATYIRSWTAATGEYVASSSPAVSSSSVAQSSSSVMSSSSSSAPADPLPAEVDVRVAAGKVLYGSNGCGVCHGDDGKTATFDLITDSTRTYADIESIIANGKGLMPACKTPAGACASSITDYVWVEFLGKTLTF